MQNGEMYMSAELIGIIIAGVGLLVPIVGCFVWMIRRTDELTARMDQRFAKFEENFNARFDLVIARIDGLQHEMTEVKIAVARLEGPRPRIAMPR